jgi:putative oxidoreductase
MERVGERQSAGGKGMKMEMGSPKWRYWAARVILATVFIYAAISKLGSPQEFADSIEAYRILPFSVINIIALGLPLFEFTCGIFVLSGFLLRLGLLGTVSMLMVFIFAMTAALLKGLTIDCGCFGAHSWLDSNPWIALIRDAILLSLAVFVYKESLGKFKIDQVRALSESSPIRDLA